MNVTKCDWCGTETQALLHWLRLHRKHPSDNDAHGIYVLGGQDLDFCSSDCVIKYLSAEALEQAD